MTAASTHRWQVGRQDNYKTHSLTDDATGSVLHLVGVVTDEVFGFMGPAAEAVADAQIPQTVVYLEDHRFSHLLQRLDPSIHRVGIPGQGKLRTVQRWTRFVQTVRELLSAGHSYRAIHFHGFLPELLVGLLIAPSNLPGLVVYSSHGSRSLHSQRRLKLALHKLVVANFGSALQRSIANAPSEVQALNEVMGVPVLVVEIEVSDLFFACAQHEDSRPQVLTIGSTSDPAQISAFVQLGVLLGGSDVGVCLSWCGKADRESRARLKAAGISACDGSSDSAVARNLSSAWVYVHPPGTSRSPHHGGFPLRVAQAMAVGVPCVAADTEYVRDLIRHGETGFIYRNEAELLQYVARLIDDAALRKRVGIAAHREAEQRFATGTFRESVYRAYGFFGNSHMEEDTAGVELREKGIAAGAR